MASCKDCLHVEICEDFTRHKLSPSKAEEILPILRERGNTCEHFKDRSMFLKLPCKSGDEVFYFDTAGQIYTSKITQFIYGTTGLLLDSDVMFESSLIGKRFFFTREAAEQALKEREVNE